MNDVCEATPIDEDAPFTLSTIRTVLFFNSYKYLLSPCSVPGTVLSTWDMEIHKRNRVSASTDPKSYEGSEPGKIRGIKSKKKKLVIFHKIRRNGFKKVAEYRVKTYIHTQNNNIPIYQLKAMLE